MIQGKQDMLNHLPKFVQSAHDVMRLVKFEFNLLEYMAFLTISSYYVR